VVGITEKVVTVITEENIPTLIIPATMQMNQMNPLHLFLSLKNYLSQTVKRNLNLNMSKYPKPHIIDFAQLGDSGIGYISVAQNDKLPFEVKRIFWTYYTPESIVRGRHAHHQTQQILVAVAGRIIVNTESADGELHTFVLDKPNQAVYIPPDVWHTMQYSHTAIQVALASSLYDERDYIRDYQTFMDTWSR
jgi:mannose-6-phosphate isomerase-like protein (cupin superfamily)